MTENKIQLKVLLAIAVREVFCTPLGLAGVALPIALRIVGTVLKLTGR